MITYKQTKERLARVESLTDESLVGFEEDMAEGFLIVKIPCDFGGDFIDPEYFYVEGRDAD